MSAHSQALYVSEWVPLTKAIQLIQNLSGFDLIGSWNNIRQMIFDQKLDACGLADGVARELNPTWLSILMWPDPAGDVLWFRQDKRMQVDAPRRIERIEVNEKQLTSILNIYKNNVPIDPIANNSESSSSPKSQNLSKRGRGKLRGIVAINDSIPLRRVAEILAEYPDLGVKTACESVAAEMNIAEKQIPSTVARWRRKYASQACTQNDA